MVRQRSDRRGARSSAPCRAGNHERDWPGSGDRFPSAFDSGALPAWHPQSCPPAGRRAWRLPLLDGQEHPAADGGAQAGRLPCPPGAVHLALTAQVASAACRTITRPECPCPPWTSPGTVSTSAPSTSCSTAPVSSCLATLLADAARQPAVGVCTEEACCRRCTACAEPAGPDCLPPLQSTPLSRAATSTDSLRKTFAAWTARPRPGWLLGATGP